MGHMTASGLTLAVTGAGGFIGRHVVAAARERGHRVCALVRSGRSALPAWGEDPMITVCPVDLAADGAADRVAAALKDADAVIHAAAAMTGDDQHHARDTLGAFKTLLAGLKARQPKPPRLVLVSSIAVYDVAALAEGATLDETTPLERDPGERNAYTRSKLAQEALALEAAEAEGLEVRIMRPGAVFGPNRLWNGHIGQPLGPVLLRLGTGGQVPVSFVEHCAEALVLAAERPMARDDRTGAPSGGRVEIINVLDDDLPDRSRYIAALKASGWPRIVVPGSWRPLAAMGALLSSLGRAVPVLGARIPGLLRPSIIHARLKPVRYSNARLHERLGWQSSLPFEGAMRLAYAEQRET
jgi:nucleoside-diphosphate-sugar epimerase